MIEIPRSHDLKSEEKLCTIYPYLLIIPDALIAGFSDQPPFYPRLAFLAFVTLLSEPLLKLSRSMSATNGITATVPPVVPPTTGSRSAPVARGDGAAGGNLGTFAVGLL